MSETDEIMYRRLTKFTRGAIVFAFVIGAIMSVVLYHNRGHIEEDRLPDDLKGCIVIFYRNDCPECVSSYPEISKALHSEPDVYWVMSRSTQGMELRESVPIGYVPCGIYFSKKDGTHYSYDLARTENDTVIVEKQNIERLIKLKHEGR